MGEGYVEKVELYRDNSGDWRWRAKAGNNRIVADSGEGYTTKGGAMEAAKELFPTVEPTLETSGDPAPEPVAPDEDEAEAEDGEDADADAEEEPAKEEATA